MHRITRPDPYHAVPPQHSPGSFEETVMHRIARPAPYRTVPPQQSPGSFAESVMRRIALSLVVCLLVTVALAACGQTPPPPPPGPAPLAEASQADLAREIADADRLGTWSGLAGRWQGQRVRWTVTRYRVLCAAADDCHVAAFPIQRPARQGWMPARSFAPGEYAARAGQGRAQEFCEVTVEATLSKLVVSPELATSVWLSDVRIAAGAQRT